MAPNAGLVPAGLGTFLAQVHEAMGCKILGGAASAYLMQSILLVVSGLFLVCKWRIKCNTPRRYWKVFVWDVAKQVIGFGWIHVLNMVFASWLTQESGDECDWYWVSILVDTTIGTLLLWVLLRAIQTLLALCGEVTADLVNFGSYKGDGTQIDVNIFFKQLGVWLGICTLMKLLMVGLMAWTRDELMAFATTSLSGFKRSPDEKLFVAMDLTPMVMNALQFLAVDSFIAKQRTRPNAPQRGASAALLSQPTTTPLMQEVPSTEPPEGIDAFLDASRVISLDAFRRFAMSKKVKARYGFDTLQRDDITRFYERMRTLQPPDARGSGMSGHGDGVHEHELARTLAAQRKLVDIFNRFLDVGQASKLSREEFKQACEANPGLYDLFSIRMGRMNSIDNAINFEIFPNRTHMSFADFHAYIHRMHSMEEVISTIEEFVG